MRPNWEHFGSQKGGSREFFSPFRPAASRGAHGPHPAIPKTPQRSPKASTRAIFGALWLKKGGPNASKAVHGWHVEPIFGQDCERMSGGGHFWSNLDILLFFKVFLWYFLVEFQGKIKSGLKGSDFFSFQFFFLSLPFCFFPVGGRGDFRVVPPYTGGLNLPPRTAMGLSFPWTVFFITFFITFFRRHFWCIFWDFIYSFDVHFV